ncbi:MAG: glycosyltransferase family 2 protein [Reyranellaceae bacterium]
MDLARITPLILTFNEAENIERTLSGLRWARRIVVVDSGSTDATADIVGRHANAQLFRRPFDSHAAQWNYGLTETGIDSDWVLAFDADYVADDAFADELEALPAKPEIDGYRAHFIYCVDGRALRGSLYPPVTVLFRRERGMFEQDGHTHRLKLAGDVGDLRQRLRHDDRKSLQHWLASQARYMRLEANKLRVRSWGALDWPDRLRKLRLVAPGAILLYCLFGRGLILDGRAGLYYSLQRMASEIILSLTLLRDDMRGGAPS